MDNDDLKMVTDTQLLLMALLQVRRAVRDPGFVENDRYLAVSNEVARRFESSFDAPAYLLYGTQKPS